MLVSGIYQSDSGIHVFILFQTPFQFRLLQNTEQHSLCCPVSPRWLSISQVALVVKNLPANDGSIPGSGRAPGAGHGNPLQYPCLENPMDRGAWWATVHGVTKNQTLLKQLSVHTCVCQSQTP